MKEKTQSTTIEKLRKTIELLNEALLIIDSIQPIVKSPVCNQLCEIRGDIGLTLTKLSKLGSDETREVRYAIGQDDGNDGYMMWDGPNPSKQDMLDVEGRDNKSVIIRFNVDGTDEVMYRWTSGEWMRVIKEW